MTRLFHNSKVFWILGLPAVFILLFLTVVGSRLLMNPGQINITPCGDVVMFRDYPMVDLFGWDYPVVRYVTTVTPLTPETNEGYVCREDNGRGQVYNHDHGRGFGKWSIMHFADPCMQDPVGFTMNIQYTSLLFGVIPLRPISVSAVVTTVNGGWELCPMRNPGLVGPQGMPGGYQPQYGSR